MRSPRYVILAGCFLGLVLGSPAARAGGDIAAGGTITFVGAVVEPTCSIANEPDSLHLVTSPAASEQSTRHICSGPSGSQVEASRIYEANVTHLSATTPDRVLSYFDHYVRAANPGGADPELVTQTYE